jgi:hypothetical protein
MRALRILLVIAIGLGLTGCKKSPPPIVKVSGTITLDGVPLDRAEVRFYPEQEGISGNYIAVAVTDENGKFTLESNGQSGACACAHRVTVSESPPPKEARGESTQARMASAAYARSLKNRPIPPRYASLADSPLELTITADRSDYTIELTR